MLQRVHEGSHPEQGAIALVTLPIEGEGWEEGLLSVPSKEHVRPQRTPNLFADWGRKLGALRASVGD